MSETTKTTFRAAAPGLLTVAEGSRLRESAVEVLRYIASTEKGAVLRPREASNLLHILDTEADRIAHVRRETVFGMVVELFSAVGFPDPMPDIRDSAGIAAAMREAVAKDRAAARALAGEAGEGAA